MDKHNNIKMKKINKRNKKKVDIKIKAIDNQNIKLKQLLMHLIYTEYKDHKIQICTDETDTIFFHIRLFNYKINEYIEMPITKGITWNIIKKIIDKRILTFNKNECQICFNKIRCATTCHICINVQCSDCYFKMYKENQGVIICPYCRSKEGQIEPDYVVDAIIKNLKKEYQI